MGVVSSGIPSVYKASQPARVASLRCLGRAPPRRWAVVGVRLGAPIDTGD